MTCPACGAARETPLACGACGALFEPPPGAGPFDVLGLEPSWSVELPALRKRLMRLSRLVHPDYFGAADERQRALAERNSAELNRAHAVLADDYRRGDLLVRQLGGPAESEQRQMPQAFLMEVLEWNETLEAAREAPPGSEEREAVQRLEPDLGEQREQVLAALGALLEPLPEPGAARLAEARAQLNALRYLDKTLAELEALRLEQASST